MHAIIQALIGADIGSFGRDGKAPPENTGESFQSILAASGGNKGSDGKSDLPVPTSATGAAGGKSTDPHLGAASDDAAPSSIEVPGKEMLRKVAEFAAAFPDPVGNDAPAEKAPVPGEGMAEPSDAESAASITMADRAVDDGSDTASGLLQTHASQPANGDFDNIIPKAAAAPTGPSTATVPDNAVPVALDYTSGGNGPREGSALPVSGLALEETGSSSRGPASQAAALGPMVTPVGPKHTTIPPSARAPQSGNDPAGTVSAALMAGQIDVATGTPDSDVLMSHGRELPGATPGTEASTQDPPANATGRIDPGADVEAIDRQLRANSGGGDPANRPTPDLSRLPKAAVTGATETDSQPAVTQVATGGGSQSSQLTVTSGGPMVGGSEDIGAVASRGAAQPAVAVPEPDGRTARLESVVQAATQMRSDTAGAMASGHRAVDAIRPLGEEPAQAVRDVPQAPVSRESAAPDAAPRRMSELGATVTQQPVQPERSETSARRTGPRADAWRSYAESTELAAPAATRPTARATFVPGVAGQSVSFLPEADMMMALDGLTDDGLSTIPHEEGARPEGVAVLSGSTSPSASVEIRGAVPLRAVLPAMVERISAALSGSFDLRLSPEELGSLKISFSTGETGLNVVIQTERPETLELFRRNIEQFTQDLKSLGYEDINLSFGNDGGRASEQAALLPQQGMSGGNDELPLAAATDGAGARETLRGGLDLRL